MVFVATTHEYRAGLDKKLIRERRIEIRHSAKIAPLSYLKLKMFITIITRFSCAFSNANSAAVFVITTSSCFEEDASPLLLWLPSLLYFPASSKISLALFFFFFFFLEKQF